MKGNYDSKKISNVCEFMRTNFYRGAKSACSYEFNVPKSTVTQILERKSYARYVVQYEQGLFFDLKYSNALYKKRFLKMKKALEDGYRTPPPPVSNRPERECSNEEIYSILDGLYQQTPPIAARNSTENSLLLFRCYNKEHLYWLEQKNNEMLRSIV